MLVEANWKRESPTTSMSARLPSAPSTQAARPGSPWSTATRSACCARHAVENGRRGDRGAADQGDRKSVGKGKGVDLGGRRIIKKKKDAGTEQNCSLVIPGHVVKTTRHTN